MTSTCTLTFKTLFFKLFEVLKFHSHTPTNTELIGTTWPLLQTHQKVMKTEIINLDITQLARFVQTDRKYNRTSLNSWGWWVGQTKVSNDPLKVTWPILMSWWCRQKCFPLFRSSRSLTLTNFQVKPHNPIQLTSWLQFPDFLLQMENVQDHYHYD